MTRKAISFIFLFSLISLTLAGCNSTARGILFADDFAKNTSGWDKASSSRGSTDYANGAYVIKMDAANTDLWANPGKNFTDVDVEVDAKLISGSENNDFGVMCRYQDADNFYFAEIASDGYYAIGKVVGGEQSYLTDGMPATDLVKAGNTTNHLRFTCAGDTLTLYINGRKLDPVTDSSLTSGDVGLIAGAFDTPGIEIAYDNIVVKKPK